MKRTALFLLLFSALAFGQGISVPPQIALKTVNGITSPLANATVTVCPANSSGIPCTPATVSLFKDPGLSQPLTNPFTADSSGNYNFAVNASSVSGSTLTVTVSGAGYSGYSYQITIPQTAATSQNFSGNNTFSGNNSFSGLNVFSNPGVFSTGQPNLYLQSLLNGCSPNTEWHLVNNNNTIYTTDAISGCATVPNGANVFQANGGAFYSSSASTTTNTVGVYSTARAAANGVTVWGANPVATDGGFAGVTATGIEVDANASQPSTIVQGVTVQGGWAAQPTVANGVRITPPSGGFHWINGIGTDDAASTNGLVLGAQASTNGSCQPILMTARDGSSNAHSATIGCGTLGQIYIEPPSGAGLGISSGSVITARGTMEISTGGSAPDALNANIANNVNVTDGGNTGLQIGFSDSGTLRGFLQARNTVGANNTPYLLSLNELGGDVGIGSPSGSTGKGGIAPDGGGFKHKRGIAGCTTGAVAGNSCGTPITVTWTTAFADANYTVNCTGNTPTNVPSAPYIVSASKAAGSVQINYFAITAAAASYATIECIAVHD